jgi:pyruvate-formate lyase-activating enzyme
MNITKTEDTVTITMTEAEAVEMRNAYRFGKLYWQRMSAEETMDEAKTICNRIALSYAKTHNEVAEVVGY